MGGGDTLLLNYFGHFALIFAQMLSFAKEVADTATKRLSLLRVRGKSNCAKLSVLHFLHQ